MHLSEEAGTWTGVGTQTVWERFPNPEGDPRDGPQDFVLVERRRFGVRFVFTTSGFIYKFDFFYLLGVVLSGLVLELANPWATPPPAPHSI